MEAGKFRLIRSLSETHEGAGPATKNLTTAGLPHSGYAHGLFLSKGGDIPETEQKQSC
jgi:hypothetical protein